MVNRSIQIEVKAILLVAVLLAGGWLLIELRTIALLLFLALILMSALNPAVTKFCKRGLSRTLSTLVVSLLVLGIVLALIAMLLPPVIIESINFTLWLRSTEWFSLSQTLQAVQPVAQLSAIQEMVLSFTSLATLLSTLQTPLGGIFNFATATFSNVMLLLSLFVMTFYLLLDRPKLADKAHWLTQDKQRIKQFDAFITYWEHQVGGWVRGELILMILIGLLTYIVLFILGVPYALPLAILAGLLEIIPNLGPTVAAIPAIALAFIFQGPIMGSVVLIATILIQQVENNLIVPKIMKLSAEVNPLVVLLAILAGAHLAGFMGALLAVPLYISVRAWYSFYILKPQAA